MITLLLAVLFITTGCMKLEQPPTTDVPTQSTVDVSKKISFGQIDTFEDGFNAIKKIDAKYQISFEQEGLFGVVAKKEYVPHIVEELRNLQEALGPEGKLDPEEIRKKDPLKRTEKELASLLISARIQMIKSQGAFHRGYSQGLKGLVGDGFYCREEKELQSTINSFNQSAQHASNAILYIDQVLTDSEAITWELVGTDESKPLFYYTPVELMHSQLKTNKRIIHEYCNTNVRLKGRPRSSAFISFEGTGFKDLYVEPGRVIPAKLWRELMGPIRKPVVAK